VLALKLHEMCARLKELSVADLDVRRKAYRYLFEQFRQGWDDTLLPVREYTEECHRLAHMRAWYQGDDPVKWAAQERQGVACRVFDPAEVERVLG
jgi:hypothetical protein